MPDSVTRSGRDYQLPRGIFRSQPSGHLAIVFPLIYFPKALHFRHAFPHASKMSPFCLKP
jgi:hypothetical protein